MANFDELLPKVSNWDVEEEEMLINKIKMMTEDYQQKCSDLSLNINNINRNLHLIEVDFFNSLNGLKTLSGTKFIEHIVDPDEVKVEEEESKIQEPVEENIKDEHFNNINNILQRSLDFMALRDQQKSQNKNNNNQEDDTMSMNSKIIGDNLMKNNRGMKLPLIIGTSDFNQNEYIGLVNDDEEEEEDFNNEIKTDVEIPLPPPEGVVPVPGVGEQEIIANNNPEDFHNMIQQNMGKPVPGQGLFNAGEDVKEAEHEFNNPGIGIAAGVDEVDTGLGGMLRKSSIKQPNPNSNGIIMNDLRNSAAGGKGQIKLSNFLNADIFGDDDDDYDDSGLFGRPGGAKNRPGFLGNSMVRVNPQNNLMLNNNMNNMNNIQMNQQNLNPNLQFNNVAMPGMEAQNINPMINQQQMQPQQEQIQVPQQNEKLPLNQRMVMVPNPLILAIQQKQGGQIMQAQVQPQIQPQDQPQEQPQEQPQNVINVQKEEENNIQLKPANNFEDKRKNLELLMSGGFKPRNSFKPAQNNENQNLMVNPEQNAGVNLNDMNTGMMLNMNLNNNINNNNVVNQPKPANSFLSQKEIEKNQKLETAKNKLSSIFGDDDDDEDDIFSKNTTSKAEKIEEKSQNLQDRLNQLTASFQPNTLNKSKVNDLFSMDNNDNTNNVNAAQNGNNKSNNIFDNSNLTQSVKPSAKKKTFFDDDDDEDFNLIKKNVVKDTNENNLNNNVQNEQKVENVVKNEPRIIMPKPMGDPSNLFQQPPKKEVKKKISLFDDEDNIDVKESSTQKTNQSENNPVKAPSTLFDGIDTSKTSNVNNAPPKENKKKVPNFLFDDDDSNQQPQKIVQPEIKPQPQIQQEQPQSQNPPKANPQPQVQVQQKNIFQEEPKPSQENSQKKPISLFDNVEPKKTEKKKTTLFDIFETDKKEDDIKPNINRNTVANVASNIGGEIKIEKEKKIKNEEKPPEPVKRLSLVEQPKKPSGNKMASRFEAMLEEQKKEKEINKERLSVKSKAAPKKLDFSAKISGLQNMLGNRIQKGGNVFVMPDGGFKSSSANIVHDSGNGEEVKTVEKEISSANANNALIEETKIQETSYEQQLEKKKESTVVVKKKKPRKIKFDSGIPEDNNNQVQEKPKPAPKKISLFDDIKPKGAETASKVNLFSENNQSNNKTSNINNLFDDKPKVQENTSKMNNLFDDQPKIQENASKMNNLFDDKPKVQENISKMNNLFDDKPKVQENASKMNNLFDDKPKVQENTLKMNNLFDDKPKVQENASKMNILFDDKPKVQENTLKMNNLFDDKPKIQENTSKMNNLFDDKPKVQENTTKMNNLFDEQPKVQENTTKMNNLFDEQPKVQENTTKMNNLFDDKPKVQENTTKMNNLFDEQPKVQENASKMNNLFDDKPKVQENTTKMNNLFDEQPKVQENASKMNNLFDDKPKVQENTSKMNNLFDEQPKVQENTSKMNNLFDDKPKIQENTSKMNNLFDDQPKVQENTSNINNLFNEQPKNTNVNNLFSEEPKKETSTTRNIFDDNSNNILNNNQQQKPNLFSDENNNNQKQNTINLFNEQKPQENNQNVIESKPQQNLFSDENISSQPKKKFKSLFEADDDNTNNNTNNNVTSNKNPIEDKRLSFLFDD